MPGAYVQFAYGPAYVVGRRYVTRRLSKDSGVVGVLLIASTPSQRYADFEVYFQPCMPSYVAFNGTWDYQGPLASNGAMVPEPENLFQAARVFYGDNDYVGGYFMQNYDGGLDVYMRRPSMAHDVFCLYQSRVPCSPMQWWQCPPLYCCGPRTMEGWSGAMPIAVPRPKL